MINDKAPGICHYWQSIRSFTAPVRAIKLESHPASSHSIRRLPQFYIRASSSCLRPSCRRPPFRPLGPPADDSQKVLWQLREHKLSTEWSRADGPRRQQVSTVRRGAVGPRSTEPAAAGRLYGQQKHVRAKLPG